MKYTTAHVLTVTIFTTQRAAACAVCFGQGSEHTGAVNLAIFTLLASVACVFGAIGLFVINMRKRIASLSEAPPDE